MQRAVVLTLHAPCMHVFCPSCRTEAREELRRQVGTLRFDLNTLASTKGKEAKKDALAARKEFIKAVSTPDLTMHTTAAHTAGCDP